MNINATFFIQIFNFGFFYWMLRVFLFKPTIKAIDHENNEKEKLSTFIDQQKISIEIKEKEHQRNWHISREYFKAQHLTMDTSSKKTSEGHSISYDKTYLSLSEEEMNNLKEHVYKKLEEKIKHVH